MQAVIKRSKYSKKLYTAIITANGKTHRVNFGDPTAEQYSRSFHENCNIHKNKERKENYINRHKSRENWSKSGVLTAGFWSRWLLWNKPTLKESANDIKKRFGIKVFPPI